MPINATTRATQRAARSAASRARLCLALCSVVWAVPGCRSGPQQVEEEDPAVALQELRELIAQGAIKPADPADGTSPFGARPEADGDYATRRLAELAGEARRPPPDEPFVPPDNPYLTFGKRIIVHPDGRITKPYPLRIGTGEKLRELLVSYGGFELWNPEQGPQGLETVRLELLEGWDLELYADLRLNTAKAEQVPLADWLVVTTGQDLMLDIENFVNVFAADVPQIEIEAKIVEVTTSDSLDVGVSQTYDFPDNTFFDSFDFAFPIAGAGGTLAASAVQDGTMFSAALEALALYENVSIISRPKIAVREGGRAEIVAQQRIPFVDVTSLNDQGGFNSKVSYQEVGVSLYVVPRVVGTETVALNIDVQASQQSGTATIVNSVGGPVTSPIITLRSAKTIVYLEPGQAVILGGLITERTVDQEEKVPILGDIPLLGWLFRSTFKSKQQQNVLFFIRPRILEGTDLNRDF
jgi:type II secretory pathway component GspD/PulD (secretin)